jgi:hypothetical protein
MASNINFASINENFPVAGQDNDTQTFRDNFSVIRQNFRETKEEITDLQENTARLDGDNDFRGSKVTQAIFLNNRDAVLNAGVVGSGFDPSAIISVDFLNGPYQIFRFNASVNLNFINFPTSGGCGKVTLELYGDGVARTVTLVSEGGTEFKRSRVTTATGQVINFPNPLSVTSENNPVIIEVWRHASNRIYLNFVGEFV